MYYILQNNLIFFNIYNKKKRNFIYILNSTLVVLYIRIYEIYSLKYIHLKFYINTTL